MNMEYRISNGLISAVISSRGGELQSLRRDGTEYLWQGDPAFWSERAPNLFPYIGRLTGGAYFAGGQKYRMKIHGFLSESEMSAAAVSPDSVTLFLESSSATLAQYPWKFRLFIIYTLKNNTLEIRYRVENRDSQTMHFGIGGHPGFRVPMEEGLSFQDYAVEFPREHDAFRVGFSETCYRDGKDVPFPLENHRLPLAHSLFDHDAIVLGNTGGEAILYAEKGSRRISVRFPGLPYLGLWHVPHKEAPYLCIEPWSSLPSRQGITEVLEEQEDLIRLPPGEICENAWEISVI